MQNLIDVLKYLDIMCFLDEMIVYNDGTLLSTPMAFDNNEPTESINYHLYSIKEALDKHDKIFLPMGNFSYDDFYDEEPGFIFGEDEILEDLELGDQYYDKYKFSLAGYGIYLDKNLNLECGYFTIEAPPSGHGAGYTTFHDFKDAKDGDIIKEKVGSEIDYVLWKNYKQSIDNLNQINIKVQELTTPIIQFIFDESVDFKEKENVLNDLIEYTKRINEDLIYFEEDSPEDTVYR